MEYKYPDLLEAFYNIGNYEAVFESLLGRINEEGLQHATKTLVLGAGPGIREIKFLNKLVPKLEKATFVEPHPDCLEEIKRNVTSSFINNVETKTFNCKMEEWQNNDEKFDVILMIHCLYCIEEQPRRDVLRRSFEQWLTPDGLLYISMIDNIDQDIKDRDVFCIVFKELGVERKVDINDIKMDIVSIGKHVSKEYPYIVMKSIQSISTKVVSYLHYYCPPTMTKEDVQAAFEAVLKRGYNGIAKECMIVIRGGNA